MRFETMPDLPGKDDFAELMVERIYQAGEKAEVDYDRKGILPARGRQAIRHAPSGQRLQGILPRTR